MCGIAGIAGAGPYKSLFGRALLALMAHRGPDGQGEWQSPDDAVWLGHRRLAIIDTSEAGHQPMVGAGGDIIVTFNGEIYNFVELRAELRQFGHAFATASDTEVLLKSYEEWGHAAVERLNGMFGFAIYDRRRQRIFCARDRFGEKPFLFTRAGGGFAFASEYKALLALPFVRPDHDVVRVGAECCSPGSVLDTARQTVFCDIEQLLPGEAAEWDVRTGTLSVWRYWDIDRSRRETFGDPREAMAAFRELFLDSVRLRMRSDVKVGSCLSGGVDSTAIVGAVRHLLGEDQPYNTFTGRFPGTEADEWPFAEVVIDTFQTYSHVVEPSVTRFMDDLPAFAWANELPVGSSSQFAQWCVFHLARENGVTVLLDGQGADELLGGYEQYFEFYLMSRRADLDAAALAAEEKAIRARYPGALMPRRGHLQTAIPLRLRRALARRLRRGGDVRFGISDTVLRQVDDLAQRRPQGFGDPLKDVLYEDSTARCLTALLRYGDRNSMAHSREVRLPFCDHRLAEFTFALPPELLMGGIQTKRLIREGLGDLLPRTVRERWAKQGFRPPQEQWFDDVRFRSLVRDTLSSASFRQSPLWDHAWWSTLLDRFDRGERHLAWKLWQPFVVEMWRKHFVDAVAPAAQAAEAVAACSPLPMRVVAR